MPDPITAPITADPDELAQVAYDNLAATTPGWTPSDGNPTARLLQAFAALVAEWAILAGNVPPDLVRFFGTFMLGIPPFAASSASTTSTWTMVDAAGYTIPAGTQVGLTDADGNLVAFAVAGTVIVAPGAAATAAGEVILAAITPGAAANDLSGPATLIDNLAFVAANGIAIVAPTSGGLDPETVADYQTRYGPVAQLVAPRPIVPADFELFARVFEPEVARALAIDRYNATTATSNVERCVTVAVINDTGTAVSSPAKADLLAQYQAKREVNFLVFVIDATYTTVNVALAGKSLPGYDPADVQARAIDAVQALLSPATWGRPLEASAEEWDDTPTLRFQDLITALNNVPGFSHYTALTFGPSKAVTAVAATDVFTSAAHGFANGDPIAFAALTGGAPVAAGTIYYARDVTANTFKIAAAAGGAAINVTSDMSAGTLFGGIVDLTLVGPAALPLAGAVAGTVTA